MTYIYILLALIAVLLAWSLVALIWGRPWRVKGLFFRTFLKFALKGPEMLTMIGILEKFGLHGHNAKLSDASLAFEDKLYTFARREQKLLRSYKRKGQTAGTLLSMDIMDWFLEDTVREERWRHHDYPLNQMFGIQSELPNFMLNLHPVTGKVEARNYVKRLHRFGVKFNQVMEGLLVREEKGCLPPRFVIQRVLTEMENFIAQPAEENPLYTVFREKLEKLPRLITMDRDELLAAAAAEIRKTVYPAYVDFISYFSQLEIKATDESGVWKLPAGDEYYAYCLRSSTTTDYSPQEIHEIGLAEVERIEKEMGRIIAELGHKVTASPAKLLHEFGQEERFLYPNTEVGRQECLADYQNILAGIDATLEPIFSIRPKAQLKVERVPEFREKTAPGAYYMPGDLAGKRPGVFYANLRDMKEVHKFSMKTLAYHEGIPGHHFQLSIAQELKGLPLFRRMIPFTAYAEGWAMYAETLAREMGMYKADPYGELGCLDSELFRAVRLVVDTGIHYKQWTREQAIQYMAEHSAQDADSIVSEVERYVVMPGQACAYKIGMIKLLELREKARAALGEAFDLRRFNSVLLQSGAMPLSLLERVVEDYISAQLAEGVN